MQKNNKSLLRNPLLGIALLISCCFESMWIAPTMAGVTFKPPGAQAPKRSSGGASRDGNQCGFTTPATTNTSVTPLIPTTNIGFTVAERPSIFVYIPTTTAKTALFTLQTEDSKYSYRTNVSLPNKPGVMQVKIPASVPALKTGKNYKWSLVMICTEELEPDSPWVSGWIRRVEPNTKVTSQLNKPASLDLISRLAETGIWYDSLANLAQLRRSQPHNPALNDAWQALLKSVDLSAIANAPLTN
ncbi:DUF928 domain-containing protein [Tolypothrix sp. FACHB-123]|uniref:DUF928 domain-containing protein n=1 Tax=Tolypothrix sp. FACHB-123 TaxID=2692868 RepID=UPI0016868FD8|nr:DUF928 domain-containing protein [Tolypothrix sp. FACHB-123]MBD2356061.1 DUF928 domain-containing protein [Tolypothrix sp. FACHB-123]